MTLTVTQEVSHCEYCGNELPPSKGKFKRKFCKHEENSDCYNKRQREKRQGAMKEVCFNCNDWIETVEIGKETYDQFKGLCAITNEKTSDLHKCECWSKYRRKER